MKTDLQKAYKDYIELLEKALRGTMGFMFAHGMSAPQEDIDEGVRLRELIEKLEHD